MRGRLNRSKTHQRVALTGRGVVLEEMAQTVERVEKKGVMATDAF
jgi:hypothetical protein